MSFSFFLSGKFPSAPSTGYPHAIWNGPKAQAHRAKMRRMRQECENARAAKLGMPARRVR